jgi:hypothetical protein
MNGSVNSPCFSKDRNFGESVMQELGVMSYELGIRSYELGVMSYEL